MDPHIGDVGGIHEPGVHRHPIRAHLVDPLPVGDTAAGRAVMELDGPIAPDVGHGRSGAIREGDLRRVIISPQSAEPAADRTVARCQLPRRFSDLDPDSAAMARGLDHGSSGRTWNNT